MYSRLRIRPGREQGTSLEERRRIIAEQVESMLARTRWMRGARAETIAAEVPSQPPSRPEISSIAPAE